MTRTVSRDGAPVPPVEVAGPRYETLGTSREGRPLEAVAFGSVGETVLILAGMHGDEPKSVYVARQLIDLLTVQPELAAGHRVVVVPVVNPDGYEQRCRRNAAGVDLNRNFPTDNWAPARTSSAGASPSRPRSRFYGGPAPASEPETQAVVALVERLQPACIVSIHSISHDQFCNNYDGPGEERAHAMSRLNGYPVTATIGYPTPGSFGTWAGIERNIPMVTLELPSHHSRERCWRENRDALLAVIGAAVPGGLGRSRATF